MTTRGAGDRSRSTSTAFWIVLPVVVTFTAVAGWLVVRRQHRRGG